LKKLFFKKPASPHDQFFVRLRPGLRTKSITRSGHQSSLVGELLSLVREKALLLQSFLLPRSGTEWKWPGA